MVTSLSSEKSWKRLIFRWTALEGATAMALFLALTVFIEYLVVFVFRSNGLVDTQTFQVPLATFTLTISPLFHLMPLGVIVVLVSSWTYHTKYTARVPRRKTLSKRSSTKPKRPARTGRKGLLGFVRRSSREITHAVKAFCHRVKASILKIRGISPAMQRLFFARAAMRSTANVILIFLVSFLILYLLGYPNLIHDAVVGYYQASPPFYGFVMWTIKTAGSIGQVLSPIGWFASTINGALISASSGFRGAFEGFITSATDPLTGLDVLWRYAICQNIAAWISAVAALVYGQYTTRLYRR